MLTIVEINQDGVAVLTPREKRAIGSSNMIRIDRIEIEMKMDEAKTYLSEIIAFLRVPDFERSTSLAERQAMIRAYTRLLIGENKRMIVLEQMTGKIAMHELEQALADGRL